MAAKLSSTPLPWAKSGTLSLPPPNLAKWHLQKYSNGLLMKINKLITHTIPVYLCKKFVVSFLKGAIRKGVLKLRLNNGSELQFGDGSKCGCDDQPVVLRVFNDWFFVKLAMEYDLGLAR